MAVYLHLFSTYDEFEDVYTSEPTVESFTCSAGTFLYDGYDSGDDTYIWSNPELDMDLLTETQDAKCEGERKAYDPSTDKYVEITSVDETTGYEEPWVSYTKQTSAVTYNKKHGVTVVGCRWDWDGDHYVLIPISSATYGDMSASCSEVWSIIKCETDTHHNENLQIVMYDRDGTKTGEYRSPAMSGTFDQDTVQNKVDLSLNGTSFGDIYDIANERFLPAVDGCRLEVCWVFTE